MTKAPKRAKIRTAPEVEIEDERRARLFHARRGVAFEVLHDGRRYVVLTGRRGLAHACEILPDGGLSEPLIDEAFDLLDAAFPWDA